MLSPSRCLTYRFIFFLVLFVLSFKSYANTASPVIVSSIKPLHSLLSNIMHGVAKPQLLIADNQSIHDYQLRPSQRRLLSRADLVFYASNHVETFMPALQSNIKKRVFRNLSLIKGLKLLDARAINSQHKQQHVDKDGHIWLSPSNAKIIAIYMSQQLSQFDPQHARIYKHNTGTLLKRLTDLQQQVSQQLKPYHNGHYLLFHDALQYFENEFNLLKGSFITSSADHKMGIKYVSALKQDIKQKNIHCIYYEPPYIPKLIYRLSAQQQVSILPIDPLALQYKAGTELYFKSIRHITKQFVSCLGRNK